MKVYVLNDLMINGVNTVEGYIEYPSEYNNKFMDHNYFKLQNDTTTNDFDYSDSDITEDQEIILHDKLINNNYIHITESDNLILYNYLKSAITNNNSYTPNKEKTIGLNGNNIRVWINNKGFVHMIKRQYQLFNIGKKLLCDVEYSFNKKKEIKELNYEIV